MVHNSCQICNEKVFFTKGEFLRAHGKYQLKPSIWTYKTTKTGTKKSPILIHKWVCKICKEEKHRKSCRYY